MALVPKTLSRLGPSAEHCVVFMPKISIIIPVYNAERYLKECLDSVVNQTFKDIEIICVDDGSTDGSLSILQEYARRDKRITNIHQENQHAGVARNVGLTQACAKYVYFLDADDWLELNACEVMYQLMEEKQVPLIKFRTWSWDEQAQQVIKNAYTDCASIKECYWDNYLYRDSKDIYDIIRLPDSPWSGVYDRLFLLRNHIKFDPSACANDTGFFFRCVAAAPRVYFSTQYLLYYRRNVAKSLITRRAENFKDVTAILSRVNGSCTNLPEFVRQAIQNKLMQSCMHWWRKCLEYPSNTWETHSNLCKLMKKYLMDTSHIPYNKTTKEARRKVKKLLLLETAKRIFSIRSWRDKKIFFLFGMRFTL